MCEGHSVVSADEELLPYRSLAAGVYMCSPSGTVLEPTGCAAKRVDPTAYICFIYVHTRT